MARIETLRVLILGTGVEAVINKRDFDPSLHTQDLTPTQKTSEAPAPVIVQPTLVPQPVSEPSEPEQPKPRRSKRKVVDDGDS